MLDLFLAIAVQGGGGKAVFFGVCHDGQEKNA